MKSQAEKFRRSREQRSRRMQGWDAFERIVRACFNEVVQNEEKDHLFENLYISSHTDEPKPGDRKWITLFFGQHPIGKKPGSDEFEIEHGCALHFSQDAQGWIWAIVYPFQSEARMPREEYIVSKRFTEPARISKRQIRQQVSNFFSLAHVTSVMGKPTRADHFRVSWMRRHHSNLPKGWLSEVP